MKKILFGLVATIMLSVTGNAQNLKGMNTPIVYPSVYQTFKDAMILKTNSLKTSIQANKTTGSTVLELQDETTAQVFISPLLEPSIAVLNYEGFTNADIISEYGSLNCREIITSASRLFVLKTNELKNQMPELLLDDESTNKALYDQIIDCLKDASGIAELTVIATVGLTVWAKSMGKKAALRALAKVGAKYLGFIGAAIFAFDVIECIYTGD